MHGAKKTSDLSQFEGWALIFVFGNILSLLINIAHIINEFGTVASHINSILFLLQLLCLIFFLTRNKAFRVFFYIFTAINILIFFYIAALGLAIPENGGIFANNLIWLLYIIFSRRVKAILGETAPDGTPWPSKLPPVPAASPPYATPTMAPLPPPTLAATVAPPPTISAFPATIPADIPPSPEEHPPPAPLTFDEPPEEPPAEGTSAAPATPATQGKPGQRFCSRCGSPTAHNDLRCPGCGRRLRLFRKGAALTLVLVLLLVASLLTNGFQFRNWRHLTANNADWVEKYDQLNSSYDTLLLTHRSLSRDKETLDILRDRNAKLSSDWISANQRNNYLQQQVDFMDKYVVLIPVGTYQYHTYNCSIFQNGGDFYIFGISDAKERGYSPCPLCQP